MSMVLPTSASMMLHTSRPLSRQSMSDAATVERLMQKHFPMHDFRALPCIEDDRICLGYLYNGSMEYTEVRTRDFLAYLQENKIGSVLHLLHRKHINRKGGKA